MKKSRRIKKKGKEIKREKRSRNDRKIRRIKDRIHTTFFRARLCVCVCVCRSGFNGRRIKKKGGEKK